MQKLTAYVHDDTARKLQAHAHANDRSLAGELRRALRLYVEMIDRRVKDPDAPADMGVHDNGTGTGADTAGGRTADSRRAPAGGPP